MKDFVGNLHHYNYCAEEANNDQIDDDSNTKIIVSEEWENIFETHKIINKYITFNIAAEWKFSRQKVTKFWPEINFFTD